MGYGPRAHWVRAIGRPGRHTSTFAPPRLTGRWRHPLVGYLLALLGQVATVQVIVLLRHHLPPFAYSDLPALLTVALIALTWGTGPSLVATGVGALLLDFFVVPPLFSLVVFAPEGRIDVLLFLIVGIIISLLASRMAHARRAAVAAVQMRDDVLSLATHDLRAPLTNVMGRTELVQLHLQEDAPLDTGWVLTQMQAVQHAGTQMLATIEELSDVARLQMGHALPLQRQDVDVGAVVQRVVADYRARPGVWRVEVDVPAEAVVVHGDRARLSRVLHNLVDNALKYSPPERPVWVGVRAEGTEAVLTVRDQGVGIPVEELPRVVTRFFRASTAAGTAGSGLGLAGAKAIVEQHAGQLLIESAVGQGTTVTVRLPRP